MATILYAERQYEGAEHLRCEAVWPWVLRAQYFVPVMTTTLYSGPGRGRGARPIRK